MSSLLGWDNYIQKGSEYMLDKERVKELYLMGYEAPKIATIMKAKKEAVRKCIQRNTTAEEIHIHHDAVRTRKGALKAINYEANKCMSDRSFIMKNRSAYKTKPNGDIVLNREVVPVVTFDTPRGLTNEFKHECGY